MTEKENILIGLCTADRPRMLSNCLASLKEQEIPEDIELNLLIVENSENPKSKELIDGFISDFPCPVFYIHEPERGIPIARNRVIDKALESKTDWIAFIDDDETADKQWLKNLLSEAEKYQADAVQGKVEYIYPEPSPFWVIDITNKPPKNGSILTKAATNNVLFSKKLFKDWKLKFDEEMRFTGGTDIDYFARASNKGAKIIYSELPKVAEKVPPSRCTYRWLFKRRVRIMSNLVKIKAKETNYFKALIYFLPRILLCLIKGAFYFVLLPFIIFFGLDKFKKICLKAGKNTAYVIGYIISIFNIELQPYKKIEGE